MVKASREDGDIAMVMDKLLMDRNMDFRKATA